MDGTIANADIANSTIDLTTKVTGILPVANGGTGAATLTANSLLAGNGSNAVNLIAPGTTGNVLVSDGTSWSSGTGSGSFIQNQTAADQTAGFRISGNGLIGGNVGIATTTPVEKLQIGDRLTLHDGGFKVLGYNYRFNGGDKRIVEDEAASLSFTDQGNILLRTAVNAAANSAITWLEGISLMNNGNVGMGTASPNARLHVEAVSTTAPSLTWNASSGQIFRNENSELAIGLSNSSPFPLYMQGRTNTNTSREIVLNPLGGNVGVGTTAPSVALDVNGSFRVRSAADASGNIRFDAANPYIISSSYIHFPGGAYFNSGTVYFEAATQHRGGIQNDGTGYGGRVQILDELSLGSSLWFPNAFPADPVYYANNNYITFGHFGSSEDFIGYIGNNFYFRDSPGGGDLAHPSCYSNSWLTYSSGNYKENIRIISDPMAILQQIRGVNYKWKDDINNGREDVGFIAEEINKVLPAAAPVASTGKVEGVDYSRIVPVLVEGIKQQQNRIEELEKQINDLRQAIKEEK